MKAVKKSKSDIEKYRVLNVLLNANSLDRYTFCVVDVTKDVRKNKIIKAVIEKGLLKESILMEDVKKFTLSVYRKNKPKYVISTQYKFIKDSYLYDLYNNKDEHKLAKHYIDNFERLENKATSLQQVATGEGLFLTDGDSRKSSWKFDITSLKMATFAFMFSIDLVLKNKTSMLLRALEDE